MKGGWREGEHTKGRTRELAEKGSLEGGSVKKREKKGKEKGKKDRQRWREGEKGVLYHGREKRRSGVEE